LDSSSSQGNTCQASWGSFYPVSTDYYASGIAALRQAGGDVIVSFGGQASTELADTCTTVAALQAQYQSVINTYRLTTSTSTSRGLTKERSIAGSESSSHRRIGRANPTLSVSLTLPVLPTGLDYNGHNVLTTTINAGARVDLVNVMAMDYGGAAPNPSGQMGAYAIQAAKATEAQLRPPLHPSATPAQLWKMVGVTPMLGVNDTTNEIFGLTDAQQLETFASQVKMGRLSMWLRLRDISCPGGAKGFASDTVQRHHAATVCLSTVFAAFNGKGPGRPFVHRIGRGNGSGDNRSWGRVPESSADCSARPTSVVTDPLAPDRSRVRTGRPGPLPVEAGETVEKANGAA